MAKRKNSKTKQMDRLFAYYRRIFEAFSAGMNNVANAVGPLVGAGLLSVQHGIIFGGLFVALGALLLGSRVLETNGKKLRRSLNSKDVLFQESGQRSSSFHLFWSSRSTDTNYDISHYRHRDNEKRLFHLAKANCHSSAKSVGCLAYFALAVSYSLIKLFLHSDVYTAIAIVSVCFATLGTISLKKQSQRNAARFTNMVAAFKPSYFIRIISLGGIKHETNRIK